MRTTIKMVDKIKVIQDIYDGFLNGSIFVDFPSWQTIEKLKDELIKWGDLKETKSTSEEFNSLTTKLYSQIFHWRMERFIKSNTSSDEIEKRISLLESDYKQIKKDIKNIMTNVLEREQENRDIENEFHAVG